jgi:hypothetical protein
MSDDTSAPKIDQILDRYIKLRDRKSELKKEYEKSVEAIDEGLDRCEAYLLKALDTQGAESIKTSVGTAYVSVKSSATVADKEAFLGYVRTHEEWSMLDIRANKTSVDEYRQANGDLPPGVNWSAIRTVNVRRN